MSKKPWQEMGWERGTSIGEGGHGRVYFATNHSNPQTKGALKLLIRNSDSERRERLLQEIHALEKLRHPRISEVLAHNAIGVKENNAEDPFMITRFVEGVTLDKIASQAISVNNAIDLVNDLLNTLDYCHRNDVIHRDVKPNNIIVNDCGSAFLIDFGLSYDFSENGEAGVTGPAQGLGNAFLRLPELENSDMPIHKRRDKRTDLCYLAGILFYLITRIEPKTLEDSDRLKPHERPAARQILSETIDDEKLLGRLNGLFEKAFQLRPEDRFQNATEMIIATYFLTADGIAGLTYSGVVERAFKLVENISCPILLEFRLGTVIRGPNIYRIDIEIWGENISERAINTYQIKLSLPKAFLNDGLQGEVKIPGVHGDYRYVYLPIGDNISKPLLSHKKTHLYSFSCTLTSAQCHDESGPSRNFMAEILRRGQLIGAVDIGFDQIGIYDAIDSAT